MRLLLTILFSIAFFSAFSQQQTVTAQYLDAQRRFTLAGRTVKGISIDTAMVNASVDSLVTQYALKGYLFSHYGPGNNVFGDEHQQIVIKQDNSNTLEAIEPVVEGNFITNDAELDSFKQKFVNQETIFNSWKRFSHGLNTSGEGAPVLSNTIPGTPAETNSWSYNATTAAIHSTLNSASYIGFVSPQKYSNYVHSLTLSASGTDNDFISTVIAYVEDFNDMVTNHAYGLNSVDYRINTTDQLIPNQHTLSLVRGRTDQLTHPFNVVARYAIVYDMGKLTQQVLVNGDGMVWQTTAAFGSGQSADVKVIRQGDSIKVFTTNWSDAPGGKGVLGHQLNFDLASNALTQKFRGAAAYGYGAISQENSTFSNVVINQNQNIIYDLRDGQVWTADVAGNYQIDTSRSFYKDYGVRRWVHNPTTDKTMFVRYDRSFFIVSGNSLVDTTAGDYQFDENDFLVVAKKVSIIPKPTFEPLFLASPSSSITFFDIDRWNHPTLTDSTFLDDRDFDSTGTPTNPIRTKPLIVTSIGTSGAASYDHNTKVLNIPQYSGGGTSYTDAQARAAITLSTTGTSGASSYNSTTGVLNVPNYTYAIPTLQQVTDAGNVTTNSVRAQQHEITNTASPSGEGLGSLMEIDYGSGVRGGMITLKSRTTNNFYMSLRPTVLTGERLIQFPDKNGTVALIEDLTGLGGGGVTSFNSRTGAVVPQSADYAAYYAAISHTQTASTITDFMSAARGAISVTGTGGSYDNTTGVITLTGGGGGTGWNLGGNTITNSGINYIGTNNNTSMRFRTNGTERVILDSTGVLSFGSNSATLPKIYFFDNGATTRYGVALVTGATQFFMPSTGSYTFNKGGDLQAAGTNQLLQINNSGNIILSGGSITTSAANLTLGNNVTIGTAFAANAKLSFGTNFGNASVHFYDGGAGNRYGMGIGTNALETFIASGGHYSINKGGDFQATGTNEIMRVDGGTGSVNVGSTTIVASSLLTITSTTKGVLFPRMTTTQRDAIASPAEGLTIYNTTTHQNETWNATSWAH